MTKTAKITIAAFFLGAIAFAGASDGVADEIACTGQATPEQTYSAYVDAVKTNDWAAAYSQIEPGSRATLHKDLVAGLIVGVGMASGEAQWRELMMILKDHGFEVNAEHQLLNTDTDWPKIEDQPRLMRQVSDFMTRNFGRGLAPKQYELTDVRITNDKAAARLKLRKGKEKTVHFKKIDAGWCLAAQ